MAGGGERPYRIGKVDSEICGNRRGKQRKKRCEEPAGPHDLPSNGFKDAVCKLPAQMQMGRHRTLRTETETTAVP